MRSFTFILFMLLLSVGFAQKSPVNYEPDGFGANWTWTVFENGVNPALAIVDNPDKSGINTSSKVAKFTALKGGQLWAGVESLQGVDLGTFSWNDNNRIVKIMVWKPVISDVGIKFDTETGWSQGERKVANTLVNQWEELTFDFSNYVNPPGGNGTLGRIVIFPDFDLSGRKQDNVVYFDNITFHPKGASTDGPAVAAPVPPVRDAAKVISVFSNAYSNVAGTDFNPGWGQSTLVSTVEIQGNQSLKYGNFNYQGTQFASPLNLSGMEKMHIDIWTANAATVNVTCISTGPVEKAYALPVTAGQWVSYDIPLTAFTNVVMTDIIQLKFDGGDGKPTIFLDNIYFYKDGTAVSTGPKAPINFEPDGFGATWTWSVFENGANPALGVVDNPDKSGVNTSSKVARFTALKGGQPWAGVESLQGVDLGTFSWNDNNRIVKIMVWKPVISDVAIKFDTETGWSQGERKVANTLVNQWEELTFDFSDYVNPPEGNGTMGRIIIFPDFDMSGRKQDNVIYFDNITFHPKGASTDAPAVAAPAPPDRAASSLISVFSNAYTNVAGTDFNPGWGQSTMVSTIEIQGNQTLKYGNFNYQGTQFASPLNLSGMEKMHIDMWTANATTVNISCISTGPVEKAYALPVTARQWVSYDIPLTAFTNVVMTDIIQLKFDGGDGKPSIYLDNIYFYKVPTSAETKRQNDLLFFPNPVKPGSLVHLNNTATKVEMFNLTGKLIRSAHNTSIIQTNGLIQGVYLMKIHTMDGLVQTNKLVIK